MKGVIIGAVAAELETWVCGRIRDRRRGLPRVMPSVGPG